MLTKPFCGKARIWMTGMELPLQLACDVRCCFDYALLELPAGLKIFDRCGAALDLVLTEEHRKPGSVLGRELELRTKATDLKRRDHAQSLGAQVACHRLRMDA